MRQTLNRYGIGICIGVLLLPFVLYGKLCWQRPSQTDEERSLFAGIIYRRDARFTPRPMMIHIVSVDLNAPGVKVLVTPGAPTSDNTEINAQTTAAFLRQFELQLAINASFFYPFREETPWIFTRAVAIASTQSDRPFQMVILTQPDNPTGLYCAFRAIEHKLRLNVR
jgi:hypothetical protein